MTLTQDLSTPVLHDLQSEKKSFVKLFTNLTDCGCLNIEAGLGSGGGGGGGEGGNATVT